MKAVYVSILAVVLSGGLPGTAACLDEGGSPQRQAELNRLNEALEQIITLLRQQLEGQQVTLLMQRVDLAVRQLAPLEVELRRVQASLRSTREEEARLEAMHTELEARLEDMAESVLESPEGQETRMRDELAMHRKLVKEQVWNLEQQALEMESALTSQRREVKALEALVDERLGLR